MQEKFEKMVVSSEGVNNVFLLLLNDVGSDEQFFEPRARRAKWSHDALEFSLFDENTLFGETYVLIDNQ